MKRFLILTLLLTLIGCGDGVNLITQDAVENLASCYDDMETTDDQYIVAVDKNCVDIELGLPITAQTPITTANPPIAIPTDTEWELIATLQRNPLKPADFYLFDEDNDAITNAYREGKHFIFEIGSENRSRQVNQARYYILQPSLPFENDPLEAAHEAATGVTSGKHTYHFFSTGWYVARENVFGGSGEATGLFIEFNLHEIKSKDLSTVNIGLNKEGRNYIKEWVRLRIYVNQ